MIKRPEIVYKSATRAEIERTKIDFRKKTSDELKTIAERVYSADFLEHYDLANRVALEKIAAAEMLQELGLGTALNEEVCRSVYINAARDEIEKAKMLMEGIKDKKIKTLASPKNILGFLPRHRLTYKNALNKIAAEEMISERKNIEKSGDIIKK